MAHIGPVQVQVLGEANAERTKWTELPSLTQKPSPVDICVERKNEFSPVDSHCVFEPGEAPGPVTVGGQHSECS